MLDDLLGELLGEAAFGRLARTRQAQLIARLVFGAIGAVLGVAGAIYMAVRPDATSNTAMLASTVALFVFMSCFWLFNVGMARKWRWPAALFVVSFVALFVTRVLFGPG